MKLAEIHNLDELVKHAEEIKESGVVIPALLSGVASAAAEKAISSDDDDKKEKQDDDDTKGE